MAEFVPGHFKIALCSVYGLLKSQLAFGYLEKCMSLKYSLYATLGTNPMHNVFIKKFILFIACHIIWYKEAQF